MSRRLALGVVLALSVGVAPSGCGSGGSAGDDGSAGNVLDSSAVQVPAIVAGASAPVGESASESASESAATPQPAGATRAFGDGTGFRSRERQMDHFRKHGREFGQISPDEYLRLAQALRDAPLGTRVLELGRQDGSVSRFGRDRGDFVAFEADGVILTYFRPNDGEAYFRRQAHRRSNR